MDRFDGWIAVIDAGARRVLPGVPTVQEAPAAVSPPVRSGFGSTPTAPSLVRVTTLVAGSGRLRPVAPPP